MAVELIEVRNKLNRLVIGQVVAGVGMFERQYKARTIIPVILCVKGDPTLEWVCEKRGITVRVRDWLEGNPGIEGEMV